MNTKKYILRQLFKDLMPIYPLYLLYFENKGMSVQQISALLAIWSVSVVLLEVPSGVMADRLSRRRLIIMGSLCKAACYFVWIFSNSFVPFAFGFILWGAGGAFISGAEEALLFDSLKQMGQQERFELYLGRGRFLSGVGNILAAVSGGFIGTYLGIHWALCLSVASGLISAGIACLYQEVNYYRERILEEQEKQETFREAMAFLIGRKEILLFVSLGILVITMAGVLDEYDAIIATDYGLPMTGVGIWMAIRFLLAALGSYFAHKVRRVTERIFKQRSRFMIIALLAVIASVSLAAAGLIGSFTAIGCYGFFYLIMSVSEVLHEDYIQQSIEDEGRSTVHSLISLSNNLYGILSFGVLGFILGTTDLKGMLVWIAGYLIAVAVILTSLYLRRIRASGSGS